VSTKYKCLSLPDKFCVGKELADESKRPGCRENFSSKYRLSECGNATYENKRESVSAGP
jgi:hypothetical protein